MAASLSSRSSVAAARSAAAAGRSAAARAPIAAARPSLSHSSSSSSSAAVAAAALLRRSASSSARRVVSASAVADAPPAPAAAADDAAAPTAPPKAAEDFPTELREDIRNIAIIAHVDHGKTTLVDAMLRQSKVFRDNQAVQERVMDSNDLERERGITILSKNTAVRYGKTKINIIDTPGHADFGGEVERVLNMCDGVLLLVDSVEGPMPQTRFVLRKALALDKKVVVVVNKVDRPAARVDWVVDATFDLFCDLCASDEQCDFPVVYASGQAGVAGASPTELADDLQPLFDAIIREVSPPRVRSGDDAPLQLLVTNLDYDEHKGRIAIGRVTSGTLSRGASVSICKPGDSCRFGKVAEAFVYDNFSRVAADAVAAGDICAVTGLSDVSIGETICERESPDPLPTISVEEPTVRMTFSVNTSPFAGREGKFVTSRNLKERLDRELERNLALRVEPGDSADQFVVSGRGQLHISILIENMRREGFEFAVGPPRVITRTDKETGKKLEPFEEAIVEVPEEHVGGVVDLMGSRKGAMLDMTTMGSSDASNSSGGLTRVSYKIPTRGLLGLRNAMLTATKGTAVLNTIFKGYEPWSGEITTRDLGSLVAHETGAVTGYALESTQARGRMFVAPGDEVYNGQVVGIHQRAGDLTVNVCKRKAATNIRSSGADAKIPLTPPVEMGLDDALEYIEEDELVEVTPESVRIRKGPLLKKNARGPKI